MLKKYLYRIVMALLFMLSGSLLASVSISQFSFKDLIIVIIASIFNMVAFGLLNLIQHTGPMPFKDELISGKSVSKECRQMDEQLTKKHGHEANEFNL